MKRIITGIVILICIYYNVYFMFECGLQIQYNVCGARNHLAGRILPIMVTCGEIFSSIMLILAFFLKKERLTLVKSIAAVVVIFFLIILLIGSLLVRSSDVSFSYLEPEKISFMMLLRSVSHFLIPNVI